MTDAFDALGLEKPATALDVERAFRALALKHHPDHNPSPNAAATMRTLIAARAEALEGCPKVVSLAELVRTVVTPAFGSSNPVAAQALAELINSDPDSPITVRIP